MGLHMWKYLLGWLPMVLIAIANGAIREAWYGKHLGELRAHQLSTFSGLLLFAIYIWALVRLWPPGSAAQAVAVGLMWLALTVAFEFLFGHYGAGLAWVRLLHDYNICAGRVWVVVPLWIAVAPYLCYVLQK
jgi:hypothetical protein